MPRSGFADNYRNALWFDLQDIRAAVADQRARMTQAENAYLRLPQRPVFGPSPHECASRENFRQQHIRLAALRMDEGEMEETLFPHAEDYR